MPQPGSVHRRRVRTLALGALLVYLVAAALVAFWPVPVDSGASGFLEQLQRAVPWATYRRVEFGANVLFFVPLGWLLSILLDRSRYLVLPLGIVTTVAIEAIQGELLDQRTASIHDVVANTTGTCIGMLIAAVLSRRAAAPVAAQH
jgi:VanZ family protein